MPPWLLATIFPLKEVAPFSSFPGLLRLYTVTTYLSTAVGVTLVKEGAPGVALDRSVNRESNAFMGSILDGVVNMEGDDAAGVEVAFTLGVKG